MVKKKPCVLSAISAIVAIISLSLAAGFYLWHDFETTKIIVEEGLTNWIIMIISLSFSMIILTIINFRSRISEYEVHVTLEKVTQMVKSDYDLRIERKNNVAENLERTLQVADNHVGFIMKEMENWKNTTDEEVKKTLEKNCIKNWKEQALLSKKNLDKIRETSSDVISANMSNNLELLAHCFEDDLDFDYERNDFHKDDLEASKFFIEDLFIEVHKINKSNPDSFENKFTCTTKQVKNKDGTYSEMSVVEAIPREESLEKKSRKQIFDEYEEDYLKRIFQN